MTTLRAQEPDHVREALAMGDTAFALDLLRERVSQRSPPDEQCRLAILIARTATSRPEDWRARLEAKSWFDRALKGRDDPLCLLEYSALMEKQGIRVDAGRLANRAFQMIARDLSLQSDAVLAEVYYRRALPLADWVREFEHLVLVHDLPVSTPNCVEDAYFCESIVHPEDFRARLKAAPSGTDLVRDKRTLLGALLDSALARDVAHTGALRLALRDAALHDDWERYAHLARRARGADSANAGTLLTILSAHVQLGHQEAAGAVFDTLMQRLGPDAMARYEGLALVADTTLRERLAGSEQVVYGEAVWGLSDPLYLSPRNERRLAHYARIVLADVLFSDPAAGRAGRETTQGQLVIRYGLPREVYVVRANRSLQLTSEQRDVLEQVLACGTQPIYLGPRTTEKEGACSLMVSRGHTFDAGGRWEFWYYGDHGPPFVFERPLGGRTARHMFQTKSEWLDSLLHRALPSSYVPPFAAAQMSALVTAFPRPSGAILEVWSRFRAESLPGPQERVDLGVFVHDRTTGRLLSERRFRRAAAPELSFGARLRVPWGALRIAAEGADQGLTIGAQVRAETHLEPPGHGLVLSDLLLGDSADAPANPAGRDDVRIRASADSSLQPGASLAAYWEIYGLTRADTTGEASARYRVRLALRDALDRPLAISALRAIGRLLGLRRDVAATAEWEAERLAPGEYVAELVTLRLPDIEGLVRLSITVTDIRTGAEASSERVIELRRER
ncbi:MAG: hypothetical protein OER21_04045 [Gemmatimonadota bacterium]|nr:hypothetical protein [Gemmatimonadota bacterium]